MKFVGVVTVAEIHVLFCALQSFRSVVYQRKI